MTFDTLEESRCFGGTVRLLQHQSSEIGLPMKCSVYLPPAAAQGKVPALIWLAGLTCNEQTFMIKAGAQRIASQLGVALIAPDTSPRGAKVLGEEDDWDFGVGAGFYLDATQPEWSRHYRMESWIIRELVPGLCSSFPIDEQRLGLFGHSMGGHGALTLALRHPGIFRTLSAFAPICAPSKCPWGSKALYGYLGDDYELWKKHDASALMRRQSSAPYPAGILVDQGLADKFLATQLQPEQLESACALAGQPLTLRRHEGYDHGYHFISTFVEDHVRFHVERLNSSR
ncbi:MAG: S-formylglutathione hydrolase [Piscinibacter sp.]|jgi:S-formylglutathione hydrolase|uniref:S-formylglutathione hydrolase n=1 Tax=Piscinibacter sp. TaxID=1903157 RepID=UPI00258B8F03|nr:S-formylglutathione hydrolase [Piscinibacter sp.]MCW5663865.1 S-formylglutathione hydrolase [Piscinibacter sp.]